MAIDDTTAGIFDNLIVTIYFHSEALILGINSAINARIVTFCFFRVRVLPASSCACLTLLSLVSQSPVNPPAIFRRHGGLPEGGSS